MNEQVQQALRELVSEHGAAIATDAARCEALLRERCPANKREVALLLGVARATVMGELIRSAAAAAAVGRVGMLARRVEDELGVTADAARWAVESWALALGWPLEPAKPAAPAPAPVGRPAPRPLPVPVPVPVPAPVPAAPAVVVPVPAAAPTRAPAAEPVPAPVPGTPEPVPVAAAAPPPRRGKGVWIAVAAVLAAVVLYVLWKAFRH